MFDMERAQTTNSTEGALAGQFCVNHIVTKENPNGTDCAIMLIEGRGDSCTFQSAEHAQQGVRFLGREPRPGSDGVCADFKARDFGPDSDWKK